VALAGGPRGPAFETEVTVQRGSRLGRVRLSEVLERPTNNIAIMSRDTVSVSHRSRSFAAFGAVGQQTLLPFKSETLTLAQAIAQAGGLSDSFADAGGVFLFRFEPATRIAGAVASLPVEEYDQGVPTVYRLDFTQPDAFFLASAFMVRDQDMIYVANAPATEFRKFLITILSPLLSSAGQANSVGY
jgi:polysaccharide export outer membrane protein